MPRHPGALAVLRDALSARGLVRTGVALAGEIRRPDPFSHLGKPWSRREAACRAQARPAVWLYRALLAHLPPERALQVAIEVIASEGARFIHRGLGNTDLDAFEELSPQAARAQVDDWLAHFFTASAFVEAVDTVHKTVRFTVTGCALARLAREAGHPELTQAFCAADQRFFSQQTPPIELHRPTTIAAGDQTCQFTLIAPTPPR